MYEFSDLVWAINGTYIALLIIYFLFFLIALYRVYSVFKKNHEETMSLYVFYSGVLVYGLIRWIFFISSIFITAQCGNEPLDTSFEGSNKLTLFLIVFPEILMLVLTISFYAVLVTIFMKGYVSVLSNKEIIKHKTRAAILWGLVILAIIVLELSILIIYDKNAIEKEALLITFSVADIFFPILIIISELYYIRKTQGFQYKPPIFRNSENYLNLKLFYLIFARFAHAILTLVLMKIDDVNNYIELPSKANDVDDNSYFMMIRSIVAIVCDKFFVEFIPLTIILNQNCFISYLEDKKKDHKENLIKTVATEFSDDKDGVSRHITELNDDLKLHYSKLVFQEEKKIMLPRKLDFHLGEIRVAKILDGNFDSELFFIRNIELDTIPPYLLESIKKDGHLHQKIQRQNSLVEFEGYSIEKNSIALIYQNYPNGSLHNLLHNKEKSNKWLNEIDIEMKMKTAIKIARSLQKLSEMKIVHGHLTPHNIIFDNDYEIKISDLLFNDLKIYCSTKISYSNKTQYTAPEYLEEEGNVISDPKISGDVYSFGFILWELLSETIPYHNVKFHDFKKKMIEEDIRPNIGEDIPEEIASLIQKCWKRNPNERPEFSEIVEILDNFKNENE